jgi:hypothetical protein
MPNGKSYLINSEQDALSFILNSCNDCPRNNLCYPCSGNMSKRCSDKKEYVKNKYIKAREAK